MNIFSFSRPCPAPDFHLVQVENARRRRKRYAPVRSEHADRVPIYKAMVGQAPILQIVDDRIAMLGPDLVQ